MKALTVCQPYATLIARGVKRVENRTWPAPHGIIGQRIAIHAGKSKAWLGNDGDGGNYGLSLAELPFGVIVATAKLACVVGILAAWRGDERLKKAFTDMGWTFEEFQDHEHTEGPFCWVMTDVQPLAEPIPYAGAQGIWNLPDDVLLPCGTLVDEGSV